MTKTLNPHVRWYDKYKMNSGEPEVLVWETRHPELEARLAMTFIEKWGMVAGIGDGEDSAGRHKVRLATPLEVVDRACQMAELACNQFARRDWFTEAPTMEEAKEIIKAREDEIEKD